MSCRQFQLGLAYTLVKDFDNAIQVCICGCMRVLHNIVFTTLKAYQKAKNTLKGTIGEMLVYNIFNNRLMQNSK